MANSDLFSGLYIYHIKRALEFSAVFQHCVFNKTWSKGKNKERKTL